MDNCYQYLLTVAQKIINEYADKKTIDKYFNLKSRMIGKSDFQAQRSHLALSTFNKQASRCSVLKTSVVNESERKKSRCKTRQSMSKSKLTDNQQLSRARVQTYSSKKTERSNCHTQIFQKDAHHALLHAATLIKNAEMCPGVLRTITFYPNTFSQTINNTLEIIANSLSAIYSILNNKQDEQKLQKQNIVRNQQKEQILKDNTWLINRLETFLDQNTTLRRMIGHRAF